MQETKSRARVVTYPSIARFLSLFNLRALVVLFAVQACLVGLCWGFSVDDAWIVSRVASNGARFGQFDFNRGARSDAITPLGFAHLVAWVGALLGKRGALELFAVARGLGVSALFASFALVGVATRERRLPVLFALAGACLPCALWAGAGLEGALVGLAVAAGHVANRGGRGGVAALLLGSAGSWRPELLPYCAAVLCLTGGKGTTRSWLLRVGLFCLPVLAVAGVRYARFGSPIPLSAVAKAPEFVSGLRYAIVSWVWGGLLPAAMLLPRAFSRGGAGWGVAAHLLALIACGGDWMPILRLSAPIYPSLLLWVLDGIDDATPRRRLARSLVTFALVALAPGTSLYLLWSQGDDLRAVVERRLEWVRAVTPILKDVGTVAAVDVGWVGLASPGRVLDLGGVTDPRLARLPGGHTHRPVAPGLFSDRDVEAWVIRAADRRYLPGQSLAWIRPVYGTDARLLARTQDLGFEGVMTVPIAGTPGQYVIARLARRSPLSIDPP